MTLSVFPCRRHISAPGTIAGNDFDDVGKDRMETAKGPSLPDIGRREAIGSARRPVAVDAGGRPLDM